MSIAANPLDYDIANGRFYSQSVNSGNTGKGFRITDDEGIPFWSEYKTLGGVRSLGYPISRRFLLDGAVVQATQRGILQWQPANKQVELINLVDYLETKNAGSWLEVTKGVPRSSLQYDPNQSWEQAWQARRQLLDSWEPFAAYYDKNPDASRLFGLATTTAIDRGDSVVMRFQRTVMTQWKLDKPWAFSGDITLANVGDWSKERGLIPAKALEPENPPPAIVRVADTAAADVAPVTTATPSPSVVVSPTTAPLPTATPTPMPVSADPPKDLGKKVTGLATWYGHPFHGRRTASGEVFDMYNPTTTACNIFPIGTWLKVTRIDNGNSVVVRVNDTGGFRLPYVVDLSWAAYQKLGGDQAGQVSVEVVAGPGR